MNVWMEGWMLRHIIPKKLLLYGQKNEKGSFGYAIHVSVGFIVATNILSPIISL